jgi:hypothetical protein
MRCMNCGVEIPPVWVKCLELNRCPACDGEIMNKASQDLLQELADAMTRMPNDPQGVAGWLLSNYRFQKMGSAEPVEKFHRKGGERRSSEDFDESNMKVDPTYNEFIKRNNAADLVARGEKLAKLKHGGNAQLAEYASMIQGVGDPYGDDTATKDSEDVMPDIEDQRAMMALASAGVNPFAGNIVGGITDMSQIINPRDIENLIDNGQETPLKEEVMLAQTAEGRSYLQRDQFKKLKAQDAISGGGGGAFRR